MKENSIKNKVNRALQSLDNVDSAKAPDDFYTKLMTNLHQKEDFSVSFHWLQAGIAAMLIMALCNIYMLFNSNEATAQTELSDFTEEYFALTSYIDY